MKTNSFTKSIDDFNDWLGHRGDGCSKPGCPVPKRTPKGRCTCHDPIMIYIPPGSHIHLTCPVHGDRVIFGPPVTWCEQKPILWKHEGPAPKVTWSEVEEFGSDNPWEVIT